MVKRIILILILGIGITVFAGSYYLYTFLTEVPEVNGRDLYVDVNPGMSLSKIAERLERDNIVTNAKLFVLLARFRGEVGHIKSGRFAVKTSLRPVEVLDILVHGKPVLYRITIPEGLPWWKTARLLADSGFVDYASFRDVLFDAGFLRAHSIPFASAEGFLMPDTYLLKKEEQAQSEGVDKGLDPQTVRKSQARRIAGRLVDTFWKRADAVFGGVRPDEKRLQEIVVLASIVEKETAFPSERPRVAGVYANRLKKNMLLQADPTVIYGLGESFSGRLLYRHLDDPKNRYNTYQHGGLPPGPICSFGISALQAAFTPEKHNYIYFVAKQDGGEHVFSERYEDHQKAVKDYRKSVRQKQNARTPAGKPE